MGWRSDCPAEAQGRGVSLNGRKILHASAFQTSKVSARRVHFFLPRPTAAGSLRELSLLTSLQPPQTPPPPGSPAPLQPDPPVPRSSGPSPFRRTRILPSISSPSSRSPIPANASRSHPPRSPSFHPDAPSPFATPRGPSSIPVPPVSPPPSPVPLPANPATASRRTHSQARRAAPGHRSSQSASSVRRPFPSSLVVRNPPWPEFIDADPTSSRRTLAPRRIIPDGNGPF